MAVCVAVSINWGSDRGGGVNAGFTNLCEEKREGIDPTVRDRLIRLLSSCIADTPRTPVSIAAVAAAAAAAELGSKGFGAKLLALVDPDMLRRANRPSAGGFRTVERRCPPTSTNWCTD